MFWRISESGERRGISKRSTQVSIFYSIPRYTQIFQLLAVTHVYFTDNFICAPCRFVNIAKFHKFEWLSEVLQQILDPEASAHNVYEVARAV